MKKNKSNYKWALIVVFLVTTFSNSNADILPKNKSVVNSSTVYFEENLEQKAEAYQLKVYSDSADVVRDSLLYTKTAQFPSFSAEGFKWGRTYYWRVDALNKQGQQLHKGDVHSFSLLPELNSPYFDSIRFELLQNKPALYAGGYLVIDYLKGIYDRSGKLVWKLPFIDNLVDASSEIRDLKFTKDNTLTFLSNSRPLEIDLAGNVVWQPASPYVFMGDTLTFHHDFQKTKRNTYLMLANKFVLRKTTNVSAADFERSQRTFVERNGEFYATTEVPVILEINLSGEVVWYWDSNSYLQDVDLNFKKRPDGLPQLQSHANAIGINDENTKVFIGFRDLSRILVIDKQSKKVELSFGEKYPSGEAKWGNDLFKQQHDAKSTTRKSMLIFNNNGPKGNFGISSILELSIDSAKSKAPVLWSFTLDFDTLTKGRSGSGGNVNELANGNILLCAGQLNRMFEVTKSKEIVWDAFIYALHKSDGKWHHMPQYRCSWTPEVKQQHLFVDLKQNSAGSKGVSEVSFLVYNPLRTEDSYEITAFDKFSGKELPIKKNEKNKIQNGRIIIKLLKPSRSDIYFQIRSKSDQSIKKDIILTHFIKK